MKVTKIALKAGVVAGLMGSSVFAQSLSDAKKAIDAEQYQQAKTILKKLVASQPAEAANYFYLGNVYVKDDYLDSAKTIFSKGVSADNGFPLNYVGLGTIDLASKNAAAAKANFDKAISLASRKDNDPYIYAAKAYVEDKNYDAALPLLEKAKAMDEKDAEVYLALGDLYAGQNKNSEAYGAYRSAFDLDKNQLHAKIALGILVRKSKAYKESADEFNAILATNANYAPAYRELAETYYLYANEDRAQYDARIKEALQYYTKYLDLTDRSLESRMRYADFLILSKDYKALEQEAQAMANAGQSNPRVYRYLGYSSYENGNYPASIQALKDFMSKVEPARVIPLDYFYLGKAQYKTGDTAALTTLTKAVNLDSTFAEEMSAWAGDAFKEKKYDVASKLYQLAVLGPKATLNDRFYIGYSFYFDYVTKQQNKLNPSNDLLVQADSAFSYVNKYAPTFATAYLFRARTNRLLDDDQNPKGLSVPHYEKFIAVLSEKPENLTDPKYKRDLADAYNNLGAFYIKSDPAKAKEYFGKTLNLDPTNSYASDVIKSLGGGK